MNINSNNQTMGIDLMMIQPVKVYFFFGTKTFFLIFVILKSIF